MDMLSVLRTIGSLGIVLGLLAGALWLVRRYDIKLPGRSFGASRRLELVERLAIDPRRSVALLRRDGREHLILLAPEGHVVVETNIVRDALDLAAAAAPVAPASAAPIPDAVGATPSPFGAVIERVLALRAEFAARRPQAPAAAPRRPTASRGPARKRPANGKKRHA